MQEYRSQRNKETIVWLPLETSGTLLTSIIISKSLSTFIIHFTLYVQFISTWFQILRQVSYLATFCPLHQCTLYNIVGNNLRAIFNFLQFYYPGNSSFPIHIYYVRTCYSDTESKLKCFHLMINISAFYFLCPFYLPRRIFISMFIFGSQTMLHAVNHKKFMFLQFASKAQPDLSKHIFKYQNAFPLGPYLVLRCFITPCYRGKKGEKIHRYSQLLKDNQQCIDF